MTYKADLINFLNSVEGTAHDDDMRKELDRVIHYLENPLVEIRENKIGQAQIGNFVGKVFTRFPSLETEENLKSAFDLYMELNSQHPKSFSPK